MKKNLEENDDYKLKYENLLLDIGSYLYFKLI